MKEEELTSLLVAHRLASAITDSMLKKSFKSFLNQGLSKHPHAVGLTIDNLEEKVSIKNIKYSESSDIVFRLAAVIKSIHPGGNPWNRVTAGVLIEG